MWELVIERAFVQRDKVACEKQGKIEFGNVIRATRLISSMPTAEQQPAYLRHTARFLNAAPALKRLLMMKLGNQTESYRATRSKQYFLSPHTKSTIIFLDFHVHITVISGCQQTKSMLI
jgi:hypothetical protein